MQIQLSQVSPEELKKEILQGIVPLINSIKDELHSHQAERYYSINEVCEMLKIDRSTLKRWTDRGLIKSHGISNRVFYKLSDIEEAMIPLNHSQFNKAA